MFTHSIRWNLQLWLAFLLVVLLCGFGVTMYNFERLNRFRQVDEDLETRLAAVKNDIQSLSFDYEASIPLKKMRHFDRRDRFPNGPFEENADQMEHSDGPDGYNNNQSDSLPPGWPFSPMREIRLSPQVMQLFDYADSNGFYFAMWLPGRTLLLCSSNMPPGINAPYVGKSPALTHTRTDGHYRDAFYYTIFGECVLVGHDISPDLKALNFLAWGLFLSGGLVLALGLGGGWWLTSRALLPVEQISASARRISEGNLSERIKTTAPGNEISGLAEVLNLMFDRLEKAFVRQRQFTTDASHELRTPLAVIISEAQTTLSRKRSAEEYRETIEVCLESAQQMRKLAESLLELARYDAGQQTLDCCEFSLDEMVDECIDSIEPLAQTHSISISKDLKPVKLTADVLRISQVILNLLSNAIQYSGEHGQIAVSTREEKTWAILILSNTGPGITPEDLPHIFERFYRGDKARAHSHGNYGLGLAISKTIIDLHHGQIDVKSSPGAGTAFTVRLPLLQPKKPSSESHPHQ